MSESTKYEGHKPEHKESRIIREYDMPLKNKGKWMRVKHAKHKALDVFARNKNKATSTPMHKWMSQFEK